MADSGTRDQEEETCPKTRSEPDEESDTQRDENKRQKGSDSPIPCSSSSRDNGNMFTNIASSPPRFVAVEEVIKAANGVANMYLAHEIALDSSFRLPDKTDKRDSSGLRGQVESIMKKAFWDVLKSQLQESPPKFKQALCLLVEIKEDLTSLLLPQHTRLRQEIDEILDLELIKQQAENGTLDFPRYAQYVLSVMARLCAPVRDDKIRQLTQTTDVVELFQGIMELLEVMKLDWTNFAIEQIRPHLQQQSIDYEKKKFKEFLESQSKMSMGEDPLLYTRKWLQRNASTIDLSGESSEKAVINKVLSASYIELLVWDDSLQDLMPETLLMDQNRFLSFRDKVTVFTLIGSIILITFATVGPSIQSLSEFKQSMKQHLVLILGDSQGDESERLESAALQVTKEVRKCLETHGLPPLDESKKNSLESQIQGLKDRDSRVRVVLRRRVLEFIEGVCQSQSASPVQIPSGLSVLQEELLSITGQFMRLVNHNRSVFGEYYVEIIREITSSLRLSS